MTNDFFHKIKPLLWQIFLLTVSAALFSLILANRSPNLLRPISMSLRTGFGLVIPLATLVMYLAFRTRSANRLGDLVSMAATLSLFAMPLAGLWASGQSQSVAISGLIPLADAASYHVDSLRIITGWEISNFSAMRPFFPGFLSFLMKITDQNLMASLAIITLVAAISFYFSVREVQRTHGAETAVFLLIILFIYFRHHSGTSMSETLGAPVGALGIALLWRGLEKRSQPLAAFGLFLSAFALNIRPGAMFILPLMLIWASWVLRKNKAHISIRFLVIGTGVIILSFALNSLFIRVLAGPSGTAFSNFSWALYGLASGGHSFNYIFQQHPEVLLVQDPERTRMIYRLSLDLILHRPDLLAQGIVQRYSMFFSNTWYSAYSFLESENGVVYAITRWIIYSLCVLGFAKWMRKPDDPHSGLVALSAIGILLSIPFVPPTDAYRVRLYAASIVIFGLLPAMGVSLIVEKIKLFPQPEPRGQESNITAIFSTLLVIMVLAGPLLTKAFSHPVPFPSFSCPPDKEKILIHFDPGSSINVLREKELFLDWMPNFHQGHFKESVHSLADINLIQYLEGLPPGISIFSSLERLSNQITLVIIPTSQLPQPGTYAGFCGQWESDPNLAGYGIFYGVTREGE
jgi:hypothetical protein